MNVFPTVDKHVGIKSENLISGHTPPSLANPTAFPKHRIVWCACFQTFSCTLHMCVCILIDGIKSILFLPFSLNKNTSHSESWLHDIL